MWAVLGALFAAAATLIAALMTRTQARRAEERLQLDTAVDSLKLLTVADGSEYAPPGVVAGAIATLAHIHNQAIAMRVLAVCWSDSVVDLDSATWLVGEVFAVDLDQPRRESIERAQLEAAVLLDKHAHELCGVAPGTLSWPRRVEFRWIPQAPLWARLYLLRAIVKTEVTRDASWWHAGGRLGWATSLLHAAMRDDEDDLVRVNAKRALVTLMPVVESKLSRVQSEREMVSREIIERDMDRVSTQGAGNVRMMEEAFEALRSWADSAAAQGFTPENQ
jgi:hypothetical protein